MLENKELERCLAEQREARDWLANNEPTKFTKIWLDDWVREEILIGDEKCK
jgi:hypothetical protein